MDRDGSGETRAFSLKQQTWPSLVMLPGNLSPKEQPATMSDLRLEGGEGGCGAGRGESLKLVIALPAPSWG